MPKQFGDRSLRYSSKYLKKWHRENPFQWWHRKHYEKNTPTDQEACNNTVLEFIEDGHMPECAHGMANNLDCSCGLCEDGELNFD